MEHSSGEGSGFGAGGGRNKGKNIANQIKLNADALRKEKKKGEQGEPSVEFPVPQDYGDGSRIDFDLASLYPHLLQQIIHQEEDDCCAITLVKLLEFFCNKDVTVEAEIIRLSTTLLIKYVSEEKNNMQLNENIDKRSLAVPSLKRPIHYILNKGIEKQDGSQAFKVKASILTQTDATPEDILRILRTTKCPIGISVDMDEAFIAFGNSRGIHIVYAHRDGMKRHAIIIVGYGMKDDNMFFIVQNTWGKDWGFNGYARFIIDTICPIFYVAGLVN